MKKLIFNWLVIKIVITVFLITSSILSYSKSNKDLTFFQQSDSLKLKEKKTLFIIDGKRTYIEKSRLMDSIDISKIVSIRVLSKPSQDYLVLYGKEANNGIIIIETNKGKNNK